MCHSTSQTITGQYHAATSVLIIPSLTPLDPPHPPTQLILDHPKCASQWAEHSSRPLKFNVLVMIIVLVASFCTGLMLDFIHVKRW